MGSMDQVVELQKTLPKLLKDMERLVKTSGGLFDESEIRKVKAINDEFQRLQSGMERAGRKGAAGFGREIKKISDALSASYSQLNELMAQRMEVEEKRGKRALYYEDQRLNEKLKGIRKLEGEQAKNAAKALRALKKYEMAQDRLSNNMAGTIFDSKVNPFNSDAVTDIDQFVEYTEEKLESLADTFSDALSGNLDSLVSRGFALTKGSIKALDIAGAKMQAKGQAQGGGGLFSVFGRGKALTGLASALKLVAGISAGVFAIFKGFQALEENVKGIHKELIDSYGATDLLASGMTNVGDAVSKIRVGLTSSSFANSLGVSLEEARQLAYTFNEIGINFGSLQDEGMTLERSISRIKSLTYEFQASAKSLGVDFGTLVSFSGEFRKELGISVKNGAYLERMSQEFGRIRDLSKQSTLNTKDFFSVVQDLSQGIGSMNIRIGEAANLFVNLSKVLGPEAAQAFTKGLAGGFKGEGIQERFKRIILTGGMKGAFKRTADQTRKDFFELFKSRKTRKLLSDIGVDRTTDFSKMSDAELEKRMGELRRRGGAEGQGAARKLFQAVRLSRAGKGGLSNQALALGDLDMSGALSAQFKQLYNVTGGKGFRDVTAIEMEKISQMTGKSLDELEQMRLLDMAMRDDFRVLEEIRDNARDSKGNLDEERAKAELAKAGLSDKLMVQNGKIVDKQGRQVDNIQDYIHAQGAELDAQNINTLTQLDLLQEVVDSTLTSADKINNFLGGILQDILGPVMTLASYFVRDDPARKQAMAESREKRQEARKERKELVEAQKQERSRAGKAKIDISKIKDPAKRKAALAKEEELRRKNEQALRNRETEIEILLEEANVLSDYDEKAIQQGALGIRGSAIDRLTSGGTDKEALARVLSTDEIASSAIMQILASKGISIDELNDYQHGFGDLSDERKAEIKGIMESYGIENIGRDLKATAEGKGKALHDQKSSFRIKGLRGQGLSEKETMFSVRKQTLLEDGMFGTTKRNLGGSIGYGTGEGLETVEARRKRGEAQLAAGLDERNKAEHSERIELRETLSDLKERMAEAQKKAEDETLTKAERKAAEKEYAALEVETAAKSKQLKEMHTDAVLEALERKDKEQLRKSLVGHELATKNLDLSDKNQRTSLISKLESKIGSTEDESEKQRLQALRDQFRMYYAEDAVSATGMTKPMLFHNGYLMEGRSDDSVAFFNPNAPNAGRGGMGGATIINNNYINGNNPAAMLDTLKRANQSQGMLMG